MTSKILLAFFVCMIAVAVEATYAEESRDDHLVEEEKCDPRFTCVSDKTCHECCQTNLHIDYHAANGNYESLKEAVNELCACYHDAVDKLYGPKNSTE